MAINHAQERVIGKLEEVLNFFRGTQIKNEDSLFVIIEQLDTLKSSLKYLPVEPPFDSIPTEIKTDIFSYLCDSGAFVAASVSEEWKEILQRRLKKLDQVNIGMDCSKCEDNACFMPEEMLRASVNHNLDVPLSVCHPLPDVDSKLLAEGLTSVSNLSIKDHSHWAPDCNWKDNVLKPTLLPCQFKEFFEELEKKGQIMENLQLTDVDFTELNQDKLVYDLISKIKKLKLDQGDNGEMLDNALFIRTLLQDSPDNKLTHLSLILPIFDHPADMSIDFADAVCKVENVHLGILPLGHEVVIIRRLAENIQTRNIKMKTFELDEFTEWRGLISPEELKTILGKMDGLKLEGNFSLAQVEAAKSLPGIQADFSMISKSSI